MRIVSILLCISLITFNAYPQLGGRNTYEFLDLTNSARVASMGGKVNSVWDDDLNLPFYNPSLLNEGMRNHMVLNYVNYFTDVNYGYVSYASTIDKIGNVAAGIHYINYGKFIGADELGNRTGTFTASEIALNLMLSRTIDSMFHVGVNLKPVYSSLEKYNSFGIAADVGVTYTSRDKLFASALVMRNIGFQIKPYYEQHREKLPFEIEIGVSQKLRHAPFRFSIVAHNLQKLDLTYRKTDDDTYQEIDAVTGEPAGNSKIEEFADKVMRHMIFGVEFSPLKGFYLRGGYNYQRRSEMKIESKVAMVGFSWGFGIKISKFNLSYGRASYHLAGASNHFSLSTDFSTFYRGNK
jgi:hypothetical protein